LRQFQGTDQYLRLINRDFTNFTAPQVYTDSRSASPCRLKITRELQDPKQKKIGESDHLKLILNSDASIPRANKDRHDMGLERQKER
jgi:hypothetical protein